MQFLSTASLSLLTNHLMCISFSLLVHPHLLYNRCEKPMKPNGDRLFFFESGQLLKFRPHSHWSPHIDAFNGAEVSVSHGTLRLCSLAESYLTKIKIQSICCRFRPEIVSDSLLESDWCGELSCGKLSRHPIISWPEVVNHHQGAG